MTRVLLALGVFCLLASVPHHAQAPARILFLILDDVGADSLAQIPTPNIDALATGGVSFERAYSHPWCKPTRDSLLRGVRGGLERGDSCGPVVPNALRTDVPTFVRTLHDQAGYLTAVVGKWHLGRADSDGLPWAFAPHAVGFDHWWAGTGTTSTSGCTPGTNQHRDGVFTLEPGYETQRQVDAVLELFTQANNLGRPLFAWVGFTDAHAPWRVPPRYMLPPGTMVPIQPTDRERYEFEVMALDWAVGEIMAALPADSWVVLLSENGTPAEVTVPPTTRAKLTAFERGVRVPLILHGPGLASAVRTDPVQLYDLPRTLLSSLGLQGHAGEGRDLFGPQPAHPFAFVRHPSLDLRAVIEERYKLHERPGALEFYDLLGDPDELNPLANSGPDFDRLNRVLQFMPAP